MYIYTILKEKDFFKFLSSKTIYLNTNRTVFFSKMPVFNYNEYVIQCKLSNYEKADLQKLQPGVFRLNHLLNLETRTFKVLVKNTIQINHIKEICTLYKEIKFSDEDVKNLIVSSLKEHKISIKNYEYPDFIDKHETKKNLFFDRVKGFIYGATSNSEYTQKYILNNIATCSEEYTNLLGIESSLRSKKMLDRATANAIQMTKTIFEKKLLGQLNNADLSQLLFTFQDNKLLNTNQNFFNLTKEENVLFASVLNKIFIFDRPEINLNDIKIILDQLHAFCNQNNLYTTFINDIEIVLNRINGDFKELDSIQSVLFKNIYAVCSNYYSLSDFYSYLTAYKATDTFIAYAFYGACKGFTNLPKSFITTALYSNWSKNAITNALAYTENEVFNIYFNLYEYRIKLCYLLNIISYDIEKFVSTMKDKFLPVNRTYTNDINYKLITLKYDTIGSLSIKYYPRESHIAKSIKYFDKEMSLVKNLYPTFNQNKNCYFSYTVSPISSTLPPNFLKEYMFYIILRELVRSEH
jgi:hypothetical protein